MTMLYAIDFGVNDALAIHGPDGPVSRKAALPRTRPTPRWSLATPNKKEIAHR